MDGKLEKVCFGHGKSEGKNGYMLDGHKYRQFGEKSGNIAEGWECMKVGNFTGKLCDMFGSSIKELLENAGHSQEINEWFSLVFNIVWTCGHVSEELGKKCRNVA